MKKEFFEYYSFSKSEFNSLWAEGLIVLDTNVLLNFYRYSEKTVTEYMGILQKFASQLWLPFQIGKEFHVKRYSVILQQVKVHNDFIDKLKNLKQELSNENRNPFLSSKLFVKFSDIIDLSSKELEQKKNRI